MLLLQSLWTLLVITFRTFSGRQVFVACNHISHLALPRTANPITVECGISYVKIELC